MKAQKLTRTDIAVDYYFSGKEKQDRVKSYMKDKIKHITDKGSVYIKTNLNNFEVEEIYCLKTLKEVRKFPEFYWLRKDTNNNLKRLVIFVFIDMYNIDAKDSDVIACDRVLRMVGLKNYLIRNGVKTADITNILDTYFENNKI